MKLLLIIAGICLLIVNAEQESAPAEFIGDEAEDQLVDVEDKDLEAPEDDDEGHKVLALKRRKRAAFCWNVTINGKTVYKCK